MTSASATTTRKRPQEFSLFCAPGGDCPHLVPQPPARERESFAEHFLDSFVLALGETRAERYLIEKARLKRRM